MRTSDMFQRSIDLIRAQLETEEDPKVIELAERLIVGLERNKNAVIDSGIDIDEETDPIFAQRRFLRDNGLIT